MEYDVDESPPRYGLELNKSPDGAPPRGLGISPARLKPDAPPLLLNLADQGAPKTPPRRGSNKAAAAAAPAPAPGAAESPASFESLQQAGGGGGVGGGVGGGGGGGGAWMESPGSLARTQSQRTPNAQRDMRRALFTALQATVDHAKKSGDAEMVRLVDHLGTQIMTLEASSARERKEMVTMFFPTPTPTPLFHLISALRINHSHSTFSHRLAWQCLVYPCQAHDLFRVSIRDMGPKAPWLDSDPSLLEMCDCSSEGLGFRV